jgi:mRNA deadenylase 3'-5' endonuclease subunit Ccr4
MATASLVVSCFYLILFHSVNISAMVRPLSVRVVTYNVLSSHLADPWHFSTLNPHHLAAENRLPMVLEKLDEEIQRSSLICLQEVSHDWAGSLHAHFANRGYHLVTGLYGKRFNGYMGVAIAWPTALMKCIDVDISRLSDKREGGWPKAPEASIWLRVSNKVSSIVRPTLEKIGLLARAPIDPWEMSENRSNILLTVRLEEKESGRSFALGNYHMPCAFYAPRVMTIHCEMAAKHVQNLAADMPYILAGDWNIKPNSSSYVLVTTGRMDRGDPEYPEPKHGMEWRPTANPMRSAYAESGHGEPDFTNYARVGEKEPFIDTLDYIFLSDHWKVAGVKSLPKREDSGGPFPNLDRKEPSDHILIAADLKLP